MMFVCDHDAKILAFGVLALGVFVSNAGFVCFPQISQMDADFFVSDFRFQISDFCFPQISQMDADFFVSDFRFQISDCFPQIARMDADFFACVGAEFSPHTCGNFLAYVRRKKGERCLPARPTALWHSAQGIALRTEARSWKSSASICANLRGTKQRQEARSKRQEICANLRNLRETEI